MIKTGIILGIIVTLLFVLDIQRKVLRKKHKKINDKYDKAVTDEPHKSDFYNMQRQHELKDSAKKEEHLHSYLKMQIEEFIVNRGKKDEKQ